ncbi:MAG: hypothetical protein LBH65_01710, partial [Desulfovibrio sp.]|nr:hypothetical protein [Desulfovibrio sp.]
MSARMIRLIALVFFLSAFLVAHGSLVALSKSNATAVPKAPAAVVPYALAAAVSEAPAAVFPEAPAAVVPEAPTAVVPETPAAAAERIAADRQAPQVRRVSADQAFVLVAGEAEKGNPDAMLTLGGMYEQ